MATQTPRATATAAEHKGPALTCIRAPHSGIELPFCEPRPKAEHFDFYSQEGGPSNGSSIVSLATSNADFPASASSLLLARASGWERVKLEWKLTAETARSPLKACCDDQSIFTEMVQGNSDPFSGPGQSGSLSHRTRTSPGCARLLVPDSCHLLSRQDLDVRK